MIRNASIADTSLHNVLHVEDYVAAIEEADHLFLSLINLSSNAPRMRTGTHLGTVVPVALVYRAIPQTPEEPKKLTTKTETENCYVYKVYEAINLETDSELSSSSEFESLSSTDPIEEGLSEHEKRKRVDLEMIAPIPGPESQLQEMRNLRGPEAGAYLENTLTEFDDLFMKHKADIGCCTIAKHPVEAETGATTDRGGARRMSPEKAERANQEVRNLLALEMIQPSLSPWASSIVMVKKKNGELRFCCYFRPLNEVTIKDAYPLPRVDESLARSAKPRPIPALTWHGPFGKFPCERPIGRRLPLPASWDYLCGGVCPLVCATPLLPSNAL